MDEQVVSEIAEIVELSKSNSNAASFDALFHSAGLPTEQFHFLAQDGDLQRVDRFLDPIEANPTEQHSDADGTTDPTPLASELTSELSFGLFRLLATAGSRDDLFLGIANSRGGETNGDKVGSASDGGRASSGLGGIDRVRSPGDDSANSVSSVPALIPHAAPDTGEMGAGEPVAKGSPSSGAPRGHGTPAEGDSTPPLGGNPGSTQESTPKDTVHPRGAFVCATSGERLNGDFNNNGRVEQGDLDLVLLGWGSAAVDDAWVHDLPSGAIDQGELDKVLLGWGDSRPDDVDCPVIDVALANDTAPLGETNSDGITFDPAIGGAVSDQSQIASLLVSVDSTLPENFAEALADLQPDGTFELSRARLEEIGGGPLVDGLHTVRLIAADVHGFVSSTATVPYLLDTMAPPLAFELDAAFDSDPVGDQTTGFAAVTFTGDSEPDGLVQTSDGSIQTTADAAGNFALTEVPLVVGANNITLAAYDIAGNESLQTRTITRFFNEPPTLTIDEGHMIEAGGTMTITTDMLSATDPDATPEQIVYTMLQDGYTGMLTGHLAFADAPNEAITSFTQADVDAGRVILRDGISGVTLPEIVADSFPFSVSDGQGGQTSARSLLFLRDLPNSGPDDDITVWRPGDSDAFLDGGAGDDAFVLRGQDSADQVMVRPSPDGLQILVTLDGNETVTLDGFEDVYFIMGDGNNNVALSGDFSGSDLSPSTVFYQGGGGDDMFRNCENLDNEVCAEQAPVDVVAHMGAGRNTLFLNPVRASFVTGLSGSDIYNVQGVSGFKQHLFPGGGNSGIQVTGGNAIVELDDFISSTNETSTRERAIYRLDLSTIVQAGNIGGPLEIDRGSGLGDIIVKIDNPGFRGSPDFVLHDPQPTSTADYYMERMLAADEFLREREFVFPIGTAYKIPLPQDALIDLVGDPNNSNLIAGLVLGCSPDPDIQCNAHLLLGQGDMLFGGEFDDILFAGDHSAVSDNDVFVMGTLSDQLFGRGGDDWMVGDRLDNFFDGGAGNDRMEGRRGDDTFVWSSGNDRIDGGEGFDHVDYTADPFPDENPQSEGSGLMLSTDLSGRYSVQYQRITGNFLTDFEDTLISVEQVTGSPRRDILNGGSAVDRFFGYFGDDVLNGHGEADHLDGGSGDDRLDGGPGDDTLTGGPGDDTIDGGSGNDVITDSDGNDTIMGGPGDDQITAGGGIQDIRGGPGNDIIDFIGGTADGGDGDDRITGSIAPETLDGGPGQDRIEAGFGDDVGVFQLGETGAAPDVYLGGPDNDTLRIVIPDRLGVTAAERAELLDLATFLPAGAAQTRTLAALGLTIQGWENVQFVDLAGSPVDPTTLVQNPPTDIGLSNLTVEENAPGAFIGELAVVDPDNALGDSHTFDLSDPRFEVRSENQLYLVVGVTLDFEAEPIVPLTIGATDRGGLRFEKTFTIDVLDVFDTPTPPTDIRLSNSSLQEESPGQAVGFVDVVDPNANELHTFTLSDPRFEVTDGVLKLLDATAVDFETETTIDVTITAEDRDQLTFAKTFTLSVIDVDEAATPPVLPDDHRQLTGPNGLTFRDVFDRARVGTSIDSAGDTNGDGFEDLIFTSVLNNLFQFDGRSAFLLPGGAGPFPFRLSQLDLNARGGTIFTLTATESTLRAATTAGIGDFNGDGLDDLAFGVGKADTSAGLLLGGQVFLAMGRAGGFPFSVDLTNANTLDGTTAFRIEGGDQYDQLGMTVEAAGDVDADGFDDLLIGMDRGGLAQGGAILLYGGNASVPPSQLSTSITGLRHTLFDTGRLASIGDVNGDGFDDLFAALAGDTNQGAILYGRAGGFAGQVDPAAASDVIFSGGANREITLDPGVAGRAGDVNSDGFEDFYLLTQIASAPESLSNELIVFYGGPLPNAVDLGDNDGSGPNRAAPIAFLADGARGVQMVSGGDFGRSATTQPSFVLGARGSGDVNGDGNDDLLLRVRNTASSQAEHAVVYGNPFLPGVLVLDPQTLPAGRGDAFEFPVTEGYELHEGFGGPIDLNGDGFSELVVADPLAAGSAFLADVSLLSVIFGGDISGLITHPLTTSDDFLLGGETVDDLLLGGLGDDTLYGRGGRDTYYAGMGDDTIVLTGRDIPEYVRIDGGGGRDTVVLRGDNLVWDLGTTGNSSTNPAGNHLIESIEVIDLGRGGNQDSHTLIVSTEDLIDLPGAGRSLTIIGDAADRLEFGGGLLRTRSDTLNGVAVDVYAVDGISNFELIVATDVVLE